MSFSYFKAKSDRGKSMLTGFSSSAFDKTITKLWDAHNRGVCLAHLGFTKQSGIAKSISSDNGRISAINMLKMMVRSVAY